MAGKQQSTQVVLVTGASSGMGKAFARALLSEGFVVYAAARRIEQMADLSKLGAIAVKLDITSDKDIIAVVDEISLRHGGVDILINNAGFGMYGAVEDTSMADARYQFEVNLFGAARLTQLLLPHMRKKGAGRIINMSSMGGKIYTPLGSWYHATKHALEGWSDCLRLELQPFNIQVVIIQPGIIATEFADVMVAPLLTRSGGGPYGPLAKTIASATQASYDGGQASSPQVIVDLVVRAVRARRPKTRYHAGKFAKPLMFIRKWMGDRVFDRLIMSTAK